MSGEVRLGGGSTTAKAISLDSVDFAIDGRHTEQTFIEHI
jgi:hypothetical protein